MKSYPVLFLVLTVVVCSVFGSPLDGEQKSLLRQRRESEIFGNTKRLVEELVTNLQKAAQQGKDAVGTFATGIGEQAKMCQANFQKQLTELRGRVTQTIQTVSDKFSASGEAVKTCIDSHRDEVDVLLKETMEKTRICVDSRMQEATDLINGLKTISDSAHEYTNTAFAEMRSCSTQNSGNILALGSCLGSLAMKTEMKGAVFLTQSGLQLARINLYMATLPTALDVCAGTSLVGAGMGTARIVIEIGSCSATNIFSTFTGSSTAGATDGGSLAAIIGSSSSTAGATDDGSLAAIIGGITSGTAAGETSSAFKPFEPLPVVNNGAL